MEKPTDKQVKFINQLSSRLDKEMPNLDYLTKDAAKELISNWLDEADEEKVEVEKVSGSYKSGFPVKEGDKYAMMLVSYAKDIYCALINDPHLKLDEKANTTELMKVAIGLVKQAKEAFE